MVTVAVQLNIKVSNITHLVGWSTPLKRQSLTEWMKCMNQTNAAYRTLTVDSQIQTQVDWKWKAGGGGGMPWK